MSTPTRARHHGRVRVRRIIALVTLAVPVVLVGWFMVEPLPQPDELALNPDRLPLTEAGVKAPSRLPLAEPGVEGTRTPAPVPPRPRLAPAGVEHSIARAYLGLAGRWPGRAEFDDSVTRYLAGTPLATIVGSILASPEVAARYGGTTNEGFVSR